MAAIQEKLLEMGAASCRAAVFANKLIDKEKPTQADYIGLDVPTATSSATAWMPPAAGATSAKSTP